MSAKYIGVMCVTRIKLYVLIFFGKTKVINRIKIFSLFSLFGHVIHTVVDKSLTAGPKLRLSSPLTLKSLP